MDVEFVDAPPKPVKKPPEVGAAEVVAVVFEPKRLEVAVVVAGACEVCEAGAGLNIDGGADVFVELAAGVPLPNKPVTAGLLPPPNMTPFPAFGEEVVAPPSNRPPPDAGAAALLKRLGAADAAGGGPAGVVEPMPKLKPPFEAGVVEPEGALEAAVFGESPPPKLPVVGALRPPPKIPVAGAADVALTPPKNEGPEVPGVAG